MSNTTSQFLNGREWRSFLTAVQCAVTYPKVIDALRASPAWFLDRATRTSSWLLRPVESAGTLEALGIAAAAARCASGEEPSREVQLAHDALRMRVNIAVSVA